MTPNLPSPSVAPTSARECVDFSFSNVADATCSRLRGATARGPDAHSDPVVFNSEPWSFNALLARWGR